VSRDPIETVVAQERELLAHHAPGGDTDPNDFKARQRPPCEACGGHAHGPVSEELACAMNHMRIARAQAGMQAPRSCKGCGQTHRATGQLVTCLESHLDEERKKVRIGVTPAQFAANQSQSQEFESARGKNKKGGGR
jgi:hypothetical protein